MTAIGNLPDELARKFPRVNLATGLAIVQAEIGDACGRLSAIEVKNRIIRKFGYLESDECGKDRRYQKRAAEPWQVRRDEEAENKRRVDEAIRNFDWGTGKAKVQA